MKTLNDVYTAFLSKLNEDQWLDWDEEDVRRDWQTLYEAALPNFKFPRVTLPDPSEIDPEAETELTNREVQILATYMKCEWLNRNILSWENIEPMYEEKDYSPANYLSKLVELQGREEQKARKLESLYYRSIDNHPYPYSRFAG